MTDFQTFRDNSNLRSVEYSQLERFLKNINQQYPGIVASILSTPRPGDVSLAEFERNFGDFKYIQKVLAVIIDNLSPQKAANFTLPDGSTINLYEFSYQYTVGIPENHVYVAANKDNRQKKGMSHFYMHLSDQALVYSRYLRSLGDLELADEWERRGLHAYEQHKQLAEMQTAEGISGNFEDIFQSQMSLANYYFNLLESINLDSSIQAERNENIKRLTSLFSRFSYWVFIATSTYALHRIDIDSALIKNGGRESLSKATDFYDRVVFSRGNIYMTSIFNNSGQLRFSTKHIPVNTFEVVIAQFGVMLQSLAIETYSREGLKILNPNDEEYNRKLQLFNDLLRVLDPLHKALEGFVNSMLTFHQVNPLTKQNIESDIRISIRNLLRVQKGQDEFAVLESFLLEIERVLQNLESTSSYSLELSRKFINSFRQLAILIKPKKVK